MSDAAHPARDFATAPHYFAIQQPFAARLVLWLLILRWLAGIGENFGVPAISEGMAMVMLAALAGLFLTRMRLAEDAALLVAGLLAWIVTGAMSYAANSLTSMQDGIALLALLGLYALFANAAVSDLRTPEILTGINRFLIAFVLIGAALAVFQMVSGTGLVDEGRQDVIRAFGSDVHPVSFAIQMVTVLIALEIIRIKRGAGFGARHSVLLLLGGVAIYLTMARTAWVMAFLTLAYVVMKRATRVGRLLSLVAFGVALTVLIQTSDRLADLGSLPFFLSNFTYGDLVFDYRYIDNSVSWRIVNWSFGFQQAMQQPIFGFGPGQSAASSYFGLEMHNILLEVLFEGGFLGLAAFIIVLAGFARLHWRLPQCSEADRNARHLANGLGLSLLLAVVFSTSLVDQLMSVLIYLLMLGVAGSPVEITKPPREWR